MGGCGEMEKKKKEKNSKKEKKPVDIRLAAVETCKTSLLPWMSLELLLPAPIDVPATNSSLFPEVVTGLPLLERRLF